MSVGSSAPVAGGDLPDYFAREVLKLTIRSASELGAVLSEVSSAAFRPRSSKLSRASAAHACAVSAVQQYPSR